MIENLLAQSLFKNSQEVSFVLGQRVLSKAGHDWIEIKGDQLTISEWEDLKDLCLQGNEKVQLETKGFISGVYESKNNKWKFAFVERKDCFRAHLSLFKNQSEVASQIENPLFWDTVKKNKGIFIVAGERRQGKTSMLQEIIINELKNKLTLIGIHSTQQNQNWPEMESVVQLGYDTIDLDFNHIIYEGVEKVVIDINTVKNWKKWIEMAEQGQAVILSLSTNSVRTILNKLISDLDINLCQRLFNVLNGIVVQKLVGLNYQPCSEILIIKDSHKSTIQALLNNKTLGSSHLQHEFKDSYQSFNQAIVQKLIRRKIDVQSAFESSDDPESLDATLKKMGL